MASEVREALLDAAQELAQARGYNAFSYRDLAERVGVRTASIHYHFPTKGDLGKALCERYRVRFLSACRAVCDRERSPRKRLEGFLDLFRRTLEDRKTVCLGGLLAAEQATLPEEVRSELRRFFEEIERWLADLLAEGRSAGQFSFRGDPLTLARTLFSGIQGSLLTAATFSDAQRFNAAAEWLMSNVAV